MFDSPLTPPRPGGPLSRSQIAKAMKAVDAAASIGGVGSDEVGSKTHLDPQPGRAHLKIGSRVADAEGGDNPLSGPYAWKMMYLGIDKAWHETGLESAGNVQAAYERDGNDDVPEDKIVEAVEDPVLGGWLFSYCCTPSEGNGGSGGGPGSGGGGGDDGSGSGSGSGSTTSKVPVNCPRLSSDGLYWIQDMEIWTFSLDGRRTSTAATDPCYTYVCCGPDQQSGSGSGTIPCITGTAHTVPFLMPQEIPVDLMRLPGGMGPPELVLRTFITGDGMGTWSTGGPIPTPIDGQPDLTTSTTMSITPEGRLNFQMAISDGPSPVVEFDMPQDAPMPAEEGGPMEGWVYAANWPDAGDLGGNTEDDRYVLYAASPSCLPEPDPVLVDCCNDPTPFHFYLSFLWTWLISSTDDGVSSVLMSYDPGMNPLGGMGRWLGSIPDALGNTLSFEMYCVDALEGNHQWRVLLRNNGDDVTTFLWTAVPTGTACVGPATERADSSVSGADLTWGAFTAGVNGAYTDGTVEATLTP